jgi:ACS family glucarate transporter-like MFS transporter
VRIDKPRRGRIRWLLVGWMFAISAVAYLDRVNISIGGSFIQKEFGLDNIRLGWVFSSFVLGYALFQAPGGRLADRFGPRKILTIATVWWAVFTALFAAIPAGIPFLLATLLATRFLLGVGEAMVFPASNRLVAGWIPSQERGLANGLIFAGVGAGAGITPPLITLVLLHYGWRWSFWTCAVIGLAAGLVWYLIARDRPEEHPWVRPPEAGYIRAGMPQQAPADSGEALPWSIILGSRNVWALTAAFAPLGGYISDRLTKRYGKRAGRCGLSVVSMAVAACFIVLAMRAQDARVASIVLAGGAGTLYLSTSCFWSVTADIGGRSAGSVSGVMNMGNQLGGTVTASLTPVLATVFGWPSSFQVAAALCAVGSLAWLLVDPYRILSRKVRKEVVETT